MFSEHRFTHHSLDICMVSALARGPYLALQNEDKLSNGTELQNKGYFLRGGVLICGVIISVEGCLVLKRVQYPF